MPPKERSKTEAPSEPAYKSKAEEPSEGGKGAYGSYVKKESAQSGLKVDGNNQVEVFFSRLKEPALNAGFKALAGKV